MIDLSSALPHIDAVKYVRHCHFVHIKLPTRVESSRAQHSAVMVRFGAPAIAPAASSARDADEFDDVENDLADQYEQQQPRIYAPSTVPVRAPSSRGKSNRFSVASIMIDDDELIDDANANSDRQPQPAAASEFDQFDDEFDDQQQQDDEYDNDDRLINADDKAFDSIDDDDHNEALNADTFNRRETTQQTKMRLMRHAFTQQANGRRSRVDDDAVISDNDDDDEDEAFENQSPRSAFIHQQHRSEAADTTDEDSSSRLTIDSTANALGIGALPPAARIDSCRARSLHMPMEHSLRRSSAVRFGPGNVLLYTSNELSLTVDRVCMCIEKHQSLVRESDVHDSQVKRLMIEHQLRVHSHFATNTQLQSRTGQSRALVVHSKTSGQSALFNLCASYVAALEEIKTHQCYSLASPPVQSQLHHAIASFELISRLASTEFGKAALTHSEADMSPKVEGVARFRAFSTWIQLQVSGFIDAELQSNAAASSSHKQQNGVDVDLALRDACTYLTGRQVAAALEVLHMCKQHRLALLVAQIGESPSTMQQIRDQLAQWRTSGMNQCMHPASLNIIRLLAGEVCVKQVDWRRSLGMHCWYAASPQSTQSRTLREALTLYESSVKTGAAPPPLPAYALEQQADAQMQDSDSSNADRVAHNDLHYCLIELLSGQAPSDDIMRHVLSSLNHTADVLDYSLVYHIAQTLLLTTAPVLEDELASVNVHYASQLESIGMWQWAVYVLQSTSHQPRLSHLAKRAKASTHALIQQLYDRHASDSNAESVSGSIAHDIEAQAVKSQFEPIQCINVDATQPGVVVEFE